MNDGPFANGQNGDGRDRHGRFTSGNSAARGRSRPFSARVNAWRKALADAVSDDDIRAVASKLISEARAGERWAVEAVLRYCIGDPERAELAERVTELESMIDRELDR